MTKLKNLYEIKKEVNENLRFDAITGARLLKLNLNETDYQHLLDKHVPNGYIVLSAFKGSASDPEWGGDYNKWFREMLRRSKELKSEINDSGYSHIPAWGGYVYKMTPNVKELEMSFVVLNYKRSNVSAGEEGLEELKQLGLKWCKEFEQKEILYVPSGDNENAFFLDEDGNQTGSFNSMAMTNNLDKFFTTLSRNRDAKPTGRISFSYRDIKPKFESKLRHIKGEIYMPDSPSGISEARIRENYGELVLDMHPELDRRIKKRGN